MTSDLFNDANFWAGITAILLVILLGVEVLYQRHADRQRRQERDHDQQSNDAC